MAKVTNKDRIEQAARELFHIYGYDRTSIDMLIKKADVSKSNFYYYFESKEDLGLSILTKLSDERIREFSKIVRSDLNAVEQFMEFYKKTIAPHRDLHEQPLYPGSFFGNMALEQSSINEKFRSILDNYFQECEALVEECLRKGMEEGFFKEDINPKETARYMVSQFEGAVLLAKARKSFSPIRDVFWQGRNLILKDQWMDLSEKLMGLLPGDET